MNLLAKKQLFISATLSLTGLTVWLTVSNITNDVEAWYSDQYYQIGLPIMFVTAAIAGFIAPRKAWLWGILIFILQPIFIFTQAKITPLIYVGVLFFLAFMVMAIGFAYFGKILRALLQQSTRSLN